MGILLATVGCETPFTSLTPLEPAEASATPGAAAACSEAAYEVVRAGLVVQLGQPAPYFPTVATTCVFYPVKPESLATGEGWAQDPTRRIGNGPFRMTSLAGDQQIGFAPNDRYWAG